MKWQLDSNKAGPEATWLPFSRFGSLNGSVLAVLFAYLRLLIIMGWEILKTKDVSRFFAFCVYAQKVECVIIRVFVYLENNF